jgi:uncharacterized membrane protein
MHSVEKSLNVNVPLNVAYNQWTQFEDFPKFMEAVKEIRQIDETHLHWRVDMWGMEKEWDAVIDEQIPDRRIAWHSTEGADNAGVVTFHYIDEEVTRVTLQMEYSPDNFVEEMGDALGLVANRVENDLKNFKNFIEWRKSATGEWRGHVELSDEEQTR